MVDARIRGLQMRACEIDEEGVWTKGATKMPLLGSQIPLPEKVQQGKTHEEALFIVEAPLYFDNCPACKEDTKDDGILIILETVRMFPAHCCNVVMWFMEGDGYVMGTYE